MDMFMRIGKSVAPQLAKNAFRLCSQTCCHIIKRLTGDIYAGFFQNELLTPYRKYLFEHDYKYTTSMTDTLTFHDKCHTVSERGIPCPMDRLWRYAELATAVTGSQSARFPCLGLREKDSVCMQGGHKGTN
jgi:hypothetical protein